MAEMTGRQTIYTDYEHLDRNNVLEFLQETEKAHQVNSTEIDTLYKYYKGDTPILQRTKTVRSEINNKIVENRALQIVNFCTNYLCGEPIQYISGSSDESISENMSLFNSYMRLACKESKDRELVEWAMICGAGYRLILPTKDTPNPFEIYTLDPRNTYVAYSTMIGNKPVAAVHFVTNSNKEKIYSIYSKDKYFEIKDNQIIRYEDYGLGVIPIIEYNLNSSKLGVFEPVLSMLNAINTLDSNRLDGVEQFIQSLIILTNCKVPDEETAASIKEKGLIAIKSTNENKADIKILSEELDQTQTQVLKDDLYQSILEIIGMPSQSNGKISDSSNNGAVLLRNGWFGAEARAKGNELMFKQSEMQFLDLALRICNNLTSLNLELRDILIKFTRRNYEDIATKIQVLVAMLNNDKVAPIDAYTVCGAFPDPEDACRRGLKWLAEEEAKLAGEADV